MKTLLPIAAGTLLAFALLAAATCTPRGRSLWNDWFRQTQKAGDATRYTTLRQVEGTCRAMQASHEADRLTYSQYKTGTAEERSWAAQARMRANATAAIYNKYILENSFVWAGAVPAGIRHQLSHITD